MTHPRILWYFLTVSAGVSSAQDWYVLETNPPALAAISGYQIKSRTPLDYPPEAAYVSADEKRVFVAGRIQAKKNDLEGDRTQVAVIDRSTGKVVKTFAIPASVTNFAPIETSGHLFAFGGGRPGKGDRPDIPGVGVLIDGNTLESRVFLLERRASQAAWTSDLSKLFVLEDGRLEKPEHYWTKVKENARVVVYGPESAKPVATIDLPATAHLLTLSTDQKWLYVVDRGYYNHWGVKHLGMGRVKASSDNEKHGRDGAVHVIEVASNKLVQSHAVGLSPWQIYPDQRLGIVSVLSFASDGVHGKLHELRGRDLVRSIDLGECPQYLVRPEEARGRLVVSYNEARFLPDESPEKGYAIPLAAAKYPPTTPASPGVEDWFGEYLWIPQKQKLMFALVGWPSLPRYFEGVDFEDPKRDVALVGLSSRKVEQVIKVGRSGVKIARVTGQVALSAAIGMATGAATTGMGAHSGVWVAPMPGFNSGGSRSGRLTRSSDGSHVYALSRETNDVTIIKTEDGGVVDKIPVGGGCFRIFGAGDGKQVCAYTDEDITFIDTASNKVSNRFHLPSGKLRKVDAAGGEASVVALSQDSAIFFDAATGREMGKVEGLYQPALAFTARPVYTATQYRRLLETPAGDGARAADTQSSQSASVSTAAAIAAPAGEALIHFFRPPDDTYKLRPSVFVDETELARLEYKSYITARVSPGVRKIQAENVKQRPVLIDVEAGNEYYVAIRLTFGSHRIEKVDKRVGDVLLKELRVLDPKWVKSPEQLIAPAR